MSDTKVLVNDDAAVRTLTLHRPGARNAMTSNTLRWLSAALLEAERDPGVHVVILTGSDPAFTAGLDLREVGRKGLDRKLLEDPEANPWTVLRHMNTPVIAAVNGACVTGGVELILHCSFVIASHLARFADTHARVGIHPGGGMATLLPQAIGIRAAREMTFTGRFVDAAEAHALGLVLRVVPHDDLLPYCRRLAADIATCDPATVAAINQTYRDIAEAPLGAGHDLELQRAVHWNPDPAAVEARRAAVIARGSRRTPA